MDGLKLRYPPSHHKLIGVSAWWANTLTGELFMSTNKRLRIKAGDFVRLRNGLKAVIAYKETEFDVGGCVYWGHSFAKGSEDGLRTECSCSWFEDGRVMKNGEQPYDIVALWEDEKSALHPFASMLRHIADEIEAGNPTPLKNWEVYDQSWECWDPLSEEDGIEFNRRYRLRSSYAGSK